MSAEETSFELKTSIGQDILRLPPQNLEAEQSVLGALMIDPSAILQVAGILEEQDFYRGGHQKIYKAMLELFGSKKEEPIDILSVSNKLREMNELENIGETSYLTSLVNSVPTSAHVVHYAEIVKRKRILRDLISASYGIGRLGYEEKENIDDVLDEAEKIIFTVSQRSTKQKFLHLKSALGEAFERIDRLQKDSGTLRGIPTGFSDLDNILGGLQRSDLIIIAARPSLGKTTLSLDIARHVATKEKIPVGIFSLEMSQDQLVDRFIAAEAGVDLWRLRTGRLESGGEYNDFYRIQEGMGVLSEAPIFIDDASTSNVLQIRTLARRLQAEHSKSEKPLGLIIIDYLQLMEGTTRSDNRVDVVSAISRSLKNLARELNIPVIAISQLNRAAENRPDQMPRLSDLRESGSIEQDSDVVLFIYREDRVKQQSEKKNIASIIIAKHRNGPLGKVNLYFNEGQVSFKNLEKRKTPEPEEF